MSYDEIKKKIENGGSLTEEENFFLFEFLDYLSSEEQKNQVKKLLVLGNVGLMISVLKEMSYDNHEWEDVKQDASIGLVMAVRDFDRERGRAFSTFAFPVIKNHIYTGLHKRNKCIWKDKKASKDQRTALAKQITIIPFDDEECRSIYSDFDINERITREEEMNAVKRALYALSEEEQRLIYEKFFVEGKGPTYEQLAKQHHMSISRVYRVIQKAIEKMRSLIKEEYYD